MNRKLRHWSAPILLSLLVSSGCTETLTPLEDVELPADTLVIAMVDPAAPKLIETRVSFWAVKGQTREVEIKYAPTGLYENGKCLRFVVPAQALVRDINGKLLADGDSVRIEVHLVDPTRYLFEFAPAG